MKYYLIAGEASGDLHASHLMAALRREDSDARFRCFGGDLMAAQGATLVRHYRDLAYMGLFPVLFHAHTILQGMAQCKADIAAWRPDVLILVDYPGFNLKMARFAHDYVDPQTGRRGLCPVYYYISPKLWAWKEWRIKDIRKYVDELFSILPFEVAFFEGKHGYPIHYVGNPTVDEIAAYRSDPSTPRALRTQLLGRESASYDPARDTRPVIALLAGSRKNEISDNLSRMLRAVVPWAMDYRIVIAGAPSFDADHYRRIVGRVQRRHPEVATPEIVFGQTYDLLSRSTAALVTSGTATLETALLRVPQVVCFFMQLRWLASLARRIAIKVRWVSLVNLIADSDVVPELICEQMTPQAARRHLATIMPGGNRREAMLQGYDDMARRLGEPGAPAHAARAMTELLRKSRQTADGAPTS